MSFERAHSCFPAAVAMNASAIAATGSSLARSSVRSLSLIAALALAAGCDHFRVEDFHGSKLLMTIGGSGARPTAPGHHLELWAREGQSDNPRDPQSIIRLLASDGGHEADQSPCNPGNYFQDPSRFPQYTSCPPLLATHSCPPEGYAIVPAVGPFEVITDATGTHAHLLDGCVIDEAGNLLWTPEAKDPATGSPQGALAAAAVQRRIDELTIGGQATLFALVPYDDAAAMPHPSAKDPTLTAEARKCACRDLWNASPASYSGNPIQLTSPVHGALYGVLDYQSTMPPQALGGIAFHVDYSLPSARELWLTDTAAEVSHVDPNQLDCHARPDSCRGITLLDGTAASEAGRQAIHFELRSPTGAAITGSAAIETNLDRDPQQF